MNPCAKIEGSSVSSLRAEIAGLDRPVQLLGGLPRAYVHLDHAACTPAFHAVTAKMAACLEWYGDGQHGSGHRSLATHQIYDQALAATLAFVGAGADEDLVYYGKNTSEVLEVLSRCIRWEPGDVVLASEMNALSSEMPWLGKAQVVCAGMGPDGSFDLQDLNAKLVKFAGRVKLVTVNGAGALTGSMPAIHAAAELAHNFRAMILAECGQVAGHRIIQKGQPGSRAQVDFLTLSGQKMYAPVGIAALIGARKHLARVTERYGTPNMAGAAALAASMALLSETGLDAIATHECALSASLRKKLAHLPGCTLAGSSRPPVLEDGLGYLSFKLEGIPAALLAAILAYESGVGVGWLGGSSPEWVRVSFGCYNNEEDIDRLVDGLERVVRGQIVGDYTQSADGRYFPAGFDPFVLENSIPF